LLTSHRAENVDNSTKLKILVDTVIQISGEFEVTWPVHPRTLKRLKDFNLYSALLESGANLVSPLSYQELIKTLLKSDLVCTDSGGLQKEAFFSEIPCVVIRKETEWNELVVSGWNTLVPLSDVEALVSALRLGIGRVGRSINPYGDGTAAIKIARDIKEFLMQNSEKRY